MLLNQNNRFEALDFCSHIVRVQEVDSRQEIVAGVVSYVESIKVFIIIWFEVYYHYKMIASKNVVLRHNLRALLFHGKVMFDF